MQDWYTYSENAFSVRLPHQLKLGHRIRKGESSRLFKGRLDRADSNTELWLSVELDLNHEFLESIRYEFDDPIAIGDSNEAAHRYHHRGQSVTRPGGFEQRVTVSTLQGGHMHCWSITFPCQRRWVDIRIDNAAGGLTWDDFEAVGLEIIRSFQFHGEGDASAAEPSDEGRASQDGELVDVTSDTDENGIEWFGCDGGPHLVLPYALRHCWKGVGDVDPQLFEVGYILDHPETSEALLNSFANMLDPNTDYGRACEVTPPMGLIPVDDGQTMVLNGGMEMTGWRHTPGRTGVDFYVPDVLGVSDFDGQVLAALNALAPDAIVDTGLRLTLEKPDLILIFAGDVPGDTAYGEISITAPVGTYRILKAHYEGAEGSLWIIRLLLEDETR